MRLVACSWRWALVYRAVSGGCTMTPDDIYNRITERFADVHPKASWGETSFFVNPGLRLPSGAYFATLKQQDGEHDRASELWRDGVCRFNFGPPKSAFVELFGVPPARPSKGGIIEGPWNFAAIDVLMPHPVYGWMGWVCVLNPGEKTFLQIETLLDSAYGKARATVEKRLAKL